MSRQSLAELHDSGAVGFGYAGSPKSTDETSSVRFFGCGEVKSFIADVIGLADSYSRNVGQVGSVAVRVSVLTARGAGYVGITDFDRYPGGFLTGPTPVERSRYLTSVHPVEAEFNSASTANDLRAVAQTMARDILHQFAVEQLRVLV